MARRGGASEGAACFTGANDDRDWEVRLVDRQHGDYFFFFFL